MRRVKLQWLAVAVAVILLVSSLTVWFFITVPIPNKIHVACVGDSITKGSSYPKDLAHRLEPITPWETSASA